jgi:hypothetical protein
VIATLMGTIPAIFQTVIDAASGRGFNGRMNYFIKLEVFGVCRIITGTMHEITNWRMSGEMPSFYDDYDRWVVASRLRLGQGEFIIVYRPNNSRTSSDSIPRSQCYGVTPAGLTSRSTPGPATPSSPARRRGRLSR